LYANDKFLQCKLESQEIEFEMKEKKKESKGLINEMDDLLRDLADWKLKRHKQSKEEHREKDDDDELQVLEQNMARERTLLDKLNRFEEQK
jgi:hypothetical protein